MINENIPNMIFGDAISNEEWYSCPHCREAYEIHDLDFERKGIERISKDSITDSIVYKCGKCGKVMKL